MSMSTEITRLDDRALIRQLVRELVDGGYCLDELDVKLSQIVPVDLDLLHECFVELDAVGESQPMRAA
ncbi:hypothetical protein EJC49_12115 [Aquibium carbonis]|uniref:Uncharacterized protein n=1 Tax=Aquibium carbonis TaxID=2495581 RepID=A0A429YXK1_9HYPH|nr:hypothetical protein [Aquibium carbonis]RST86161.1 hypothetical protein EJC49_12115 [Aquibium carbonis]